MTTLLRYGGSAVIILWGIGNLILTRNIVAGFDALSPDNARILTMEWIIEGCTLCFLGVQVAIVTAIFRPIAAPTVLIARLSALMLLLLAVISLFTGARTSTLPMKLCPYVKSLVAAACLAATVL